MPITKNAQKAHRSAQNKRIYNLRRLRTMRTFVKRIRRLAAAGDTATATAELPKAYQAIDKAAKRGVIKANTAARTKSRLVKAINRTS